MDTISFMVSHIHCLFAYMYIQMSWYYFSFQDYWSAYLILWDRVMLFMKLKTKLRKNDGKDNLQVKHPQ